MPTLRISQPNVQVPVKYHDLLVRPGSRATEASRMGSRIYQYPGYSVSIRKLSPTPKSALQRVASMERHVTIGSMDAMGLFKAFATPSSAQPLSWRSSLSCVLIVAILIISKILKMTCVCVYEGRPIGYRLYFILETLHYR